MLDSEAIEFLVDKLTKSVEPVLINNGREAEAFVINGKTEWVSKEQPAREHRVCNVESLAGYATEKSVIWHDENQVMLVIDDSDPFRTHKATWGLTGSARYEAITQGAATPRTHKDFVKFLVQNLREEIDRDMPGLLNTIRQLKFSSSDEQEGEIKHGRESMGRQIRNDVTGASELPETFKLNVTRWGELDIHVEIEVMFSVDLDNRTLALAPLADSVVKANLNAHQQLSELIRQNVNCPVYHGSH